MFYKEIICLANSRKMQGRCVAGKDVNSGEWIRPVSKEKFEEWPEKILLKDGKELSLLDIVRIPLKENKPAYYQPENILVSDGVWEKTAKFDKTKLDTLCDNPDSIWVGENAQGIDIEYLKKNGIDSSLLFIKIPSILIRRKDEYNKKKVRAIFTYNNKQYDLSVTDPIFEEEYKNMSEGEYKISGKIYLCISLGEPFLKLNCCYKVVAAVIKI